MKFLNFDGPNLANSTPLQNENSMKKARLTNLEIFLGTEKCLKFINAEKSRVLILF